MPKQYVLPDEVATVTAELSPDQQLQLAAGQAVSDLPYSSVPGVDIDHRLLVNRKEKLAMHRLWLHAQFQKPI